MDARTQGVNFCQSKGLFYVSYNDKVKKGKSASRTRMVQPWWASTHVRMHGIVIMILGAITVVP